MAEAKYIDPCTSKMHAHSSKFSLNYKIFKPLDDAFRCSICFDYYTNCMMTKCSHNYCSLCIRRYMTYKSQCPTCFQDAAEPELRNNRLVDEILRLYKKLRSLDDESSSFPCIASDSSVAEETSCSSQSTSSMFSQSSISNESSMTKVKIEIPDDDEKYKNKLKFHIKREPDVDEVTCPVCYKIVLAGRINSHLDVCLKEQFTDEFDRRKTLPKLVYHLLSEKDLKSKLREHGLSTSGDRQALVRRHKNFITLYNANCDSLNPKSVSELVKEIDLQEVEEKVNSLPKQVQVNKKSDPSLINQQHQSYITKHQSQFNALISDIHQRQYANIRIKKEEDDSYIEQYENQANKRISDTSDIGNEDSTIEDPSSPGEETKEMTDDDTDASSSDEFNVSKIAINIHRKRKKGAVSIKTTDSPTKK